MEALGDMAARAEPSGTSTGYVVSNGGPSVKAGLDDVDQVWAYLGAHELSYSSWRYTYILWFAFAVMGGLYTLGHHLRIPGTSLGAIYSKWSMRRTTFGGKVGVKARSLPSNGNIVSLVLIVFVAIVLCVVGPDYISPEIPALRKREGNPDFTIHKTWWSSGSRFGDIAFAMIPLVVIFALRSAPFNFLSIQWTMGFLSDKFLMLHKCIGWFIWGLTTLHVAFWTVNLAIDRNNGRAQWYFMFNNHRFVGGCTAYTAMTLLMVFSLKPVRLRRFEIFYSAHILFVILMMVFSVVHHQVMWFWIGVPAMLWACERVYRFIRFMRINGWLSKNLKAEGGMFRQPTNNEYGMDELKPLGEGHHSRQGLMADDNGYRAASRPSSMYRQQFYDDGTVKPAGDVYDFTHETDGGHDEPIGQPVSVVGYDSKRPSDTVPLAAGQSESVNIPPGYAHAQLLPSRTIRLTIRPVNPFKWPTGSSCILTLPDLSTYQTHPFTITNNGPDVVIIVKARKGLTRKLFNLVRTRSLAMVGIDAAPGNKQISLDSLKEGDGEITVPPVFLKAWVDGPFGSVQRARWHEYSTVLMICGGSGVSFGSSVTEFVCQTLAKAGRPDGWKTQRARLCWVVREYAEIAWVANQLRKCQEMVPADRLQIDIFVTKAKPARPAPQEKTDDDELAMPKPAFAAGAGMGRNGSSDSLASMMSQDHLMETEDMVDAHLEENYADIIDLTNYEDEEDIDDPNESLLSDRIQQQGKLRRARTRKTIRREARNAAKVRKDPHGHQGYGHAHQHGPPQITVSNDDDEGDEITEAPYDQYDPFSSARMRAPSPAPSRGYDDDHHSAHGRGGHDPSQKIKARPNSMVLLETGNLDPQGDAAIWIDSIDYEAMQVLSEMARPGKPKLAQVLEEEIELAQGSIIVGTCGPVTLNTMVRKIISTHISPGKIRQGDRTGHIALFSEDYE